MQRKVTIISITIPLVLILMIILLMSLRFGVFHKFQTWAEEEYQGKKLTLFEKYLASRKIILYDLNGFLSQNERDDFRLLRGKALKKSQNLYHFWGGKEHEFPYFYVGTVNYGAYVVVENGKIIEFVKNKSVDSL